MTLTPEGWLERLAWAMDYRRNRISVLRSYMDGNAPLPEGADGCRDAYKTFQKKARTNFGELAVDAVGDRMIPSGFSVGGTQEDSDPARAIWKRNRLKITVADVLRDMLGLSCGYMIIGGDKGGAVITRERPEQVITEHEPQRPDMVRAGLKVYRDPVARLDSAYVHIPGEVHFFRRPVASVPLPTYGMSGTGVEQPVYGVLGGWEYVGGADTGLSVPPIVPFENRGSLGEFEPHIDVLDRINWSVLQRLVITAMQAYRQRATKGDLPDTDDEGNEIDYGEMFAPGPGALWRLPEGVDLWESQTTELTSILAASKDDIAHFAAVTRTPMATLIPDAANQSAEGASFAREGLVFKAEDRIARAGAALDATMGIALAIESGQRDPVTDIESLWLPADRQTLQERADAATKAQDLPWRTRMTDIWQFSADRVDEMEGQRAADALNTALATQPTQPPVPNAQPAA